MIGINCCFDPTMALETIGLMKAGLESAGLKTYLMMQPLGFHTQDLKDKRGYGMLPEYPLGE